MVFTEKLAFRPRPIGNEGLCLEDPGPLSPLYLTAMVLNEGEYSSMLVLVILNCYNTVAETGWLVNYRHLFLQVL